MAHLSASIDIPVSPDEIWQLIGGFGSLPNWLSFMPTSELTEGGRVRRLANRDGETLVERLVAFDDTARSYSYSFLDAPLGMSVRDLAARLRLPAHGAPPPINSSASSSHQVSTASLASSASPEPR